MGHAFEGRRTGSRAEVGVSSWDDGDRRAQWTYGLPLPEKGTGSIGARPRGKDLSLLPGSQGLTDVFYGSMWRQQNTRTTRRWFVFDDRHVQTRRNGAYEGLGS